MIRNQIFLPFSKDEMEDQTRFSIKDDTLSNNNNILVTDILHNNNLMHVNGNPKGGDQDEDNESKHSIDCKCLHPFVRSFSEGMVLFREKKQCEKCAS